MQNETSISFGDNVIVKDLELTRNLGLAGKSGQVYGETTPSITNVEVIGKPKTDYAINVYFEDLKMGYWLSSDLLEFKDHAAGTKVEINNVELIRNKDGEWIGNSKESKKLESFFNKIFGKR